MPLFRQSQIKKYTPRSVKLTDLYKHSLKLKDLSSADIIKVKTALQSSGYDRSTADKIINGQDLSIKGAKEAVGSLAKAGLPGLGPDTDRLVDKYLEQEAIKRKNIAGRRRELMMESLQEDIYQAKGSKPKPNIKTTIKLKSGGGSVKLGF